MGAFFTILFLVATVLIIYFKQISEGYDDKDRFETLQKVGMDDLEVKCILASSAVFTIAYVIVFRLTAKTYYRIVKW